MIHLKHVAKSHVSLSVIILISALYLLAQSAYFSWILTHLTFIDPTQSTKWVWPGIVSLLTSSLLAKTPYLLINFLHPLSLSEPWRYITPALLHLEFQHFLLNLFWFTFLAPDLEKKMGTVKTLFVLIFAAFFTNTMQYLFQGPFFLGLSGVNAFLLGLSLIHPVLSSRAFFVPHKLQAIRISALFLIVIAGADLAIYVLNSLASWSISQLHIAHFAHLSGLFAGIFLGPFIVASHCIVPKFKGIRS